MTKKDRIQVFQSLVIEFHQNIKVQWKSSKDYTFFGHKWVEEKDEMYNDPHLTNRLYNLLLSEIKHCQKISGESIPDSIDYNELVLIMKGGGIKGLAYVKKGFYEAESFTKWLEELLASKLESPTSVRLKDLPYKTTVYASRRDKNALIFSSFEKESMEKNAAFAARCSMSIPIFFTPQYSEGLRVFDGGTQNNFPVKVLLDKYPDTNFLGLYLGAETYKHEKKNLLGDILSIWTESSDPDVLREYKNNIVVKINRIYIIIMKKTDLNFESRKNDLELLREKLKAKKRKKKFFIKSSCLLIIFLIIATYFYGNHFSF